MLAILGGRGGDRCVPHRMRTLRPLLLLSVGCLTTYYVSPDSFGAHGGFFRVRLAHIPVLLVLGCLPAPRAGWPRTTAWALTVALATLNVGLVARDTAAKVLRTPRRQRAA